jgi:hypothetical protein
MKRYHRMLRFRLARLEGDELRGPLEDENLRVEQIRAEAHDVIIDVSLDADSAEEADSRALAAVRFIPAWRVVMTRTDSPTVRARSRRIPTSA